jgi:hypothetical protein
MERDQLWHSACGGLVRLAVFLLSRDVTRTEFRAVFSAENGPAWSRVT